MKLKKTGEINLRLEIPEGMTNCGTSYLSGQTNLKNNELIIHTKDPKCKYQGELTFGDGTKCFFDFTFKMAYGRIFLIKKEGSRFLETLL